MTKNQNAPILSLVGKSGVGKTTLLEELIPHLTSAGLRVGVIKHHAHITPIDDPRKDSARFAVVGAAAVVVSSPVEVAQFERVSKEQSLAELAARLPEVDLILTEGYKREAAPKIELSRAAVGTELVARPADLVAVVSDHPVPLNLPRFELEDSEGLAAWIVGTFLPGQAGKRS